jgi:hypothetical protein
MSEPRISVILPDAPPLLSPRSARILWQILLEARERQEYPSAPACTIHALEPDEEAAER